MGRQAYLAKIAFGRSAFEPTNEVTESDEYIQLSSSQSDDQLPQRYREASANNYIQLFDERGNPVNPRSHTYAKRLRDAQNDVLASVGVVERRRPAHQSLPGSYEERLQELEAEETIGNVLAITSTVAENLCTWWIGSLRDRILTFRIPNALSFVQITATERAASGNSIVYTGFAPRLVSTIGIQALVYTAYVYQPLERMVHFTQASSRTRRFLRRSKSLLAFGFRLGLEFLFYPFSYHASLQRLGLIPARPLLPNWRSFIPFSSRSPLLPLSAHHDASGSSFNITRLIFTSPVIMVIAEHFYERWVYSAIFEAVESLIIKPDNADIESPDAISKERATSILGLQRRSPPLVRSAVNKLLVLLGWSEPDHVPVTNQVLSVPHAEQSVEVNGTQVTDLTSIHIPVIQRESPNTDGAIENTVTVPIDFLGDSMRPRTPPTPTTSDHDENDPRIRITSREGIVEMEVRLPPRVISSHTEILDVHPAPSNHNQLASRSSRPRVSPPSRHRVTQLSTEPSQMIGAIVKAQLVGLAVLPFKLVVLRLVASHYLKNRRDHGFASRFVEPFPDLSDLSLRSIGIGMSRVALCSALELVIDLSLWSAQYLAVVTVGKKVFDWGAL
ncbi:hypothetical protein E8E13_009606 [Curvularia kusanoi]|uniref:Uncharacterized protein n=1 Tax=Curvularia kusanoi TaxID=90978 RepID=A0A9P4THL5_CURKU|nr:hypothetical protein E8E13_009606 [Curvularia kusanoi]